MHESEAYKVLQIERGSSEKEIKEAYANLSKQYHPEEYPDEFQRIHEAYMVLRRRNRGQRAESQNQENVEPKTPDTYEEQMAEAKAPDTYEEQAAEPTVPDSYEEQTYDTEAAEQNPEDTYNFDEVIKEDERKDEERLILLIHKALLEMEMLLKPQYCDKLKLFQEFFKKPEYQTALKQPAFMEYFAQMLENGQLKPIIYDYIIEYYRFRGLNPEEMYEEAAKLYYVLDEKRGMKRKKPGFWQGIVPVAVIAGIRAGTRSATPGTSVGNLFGFLFVVVLIIALIVLLYRQLYKNHSSLFAQAVVALLLIVSQFIVLMGDFYASLMGTDVGTMLAVFLFLLGGIWLIGIAIAAIIKKIKRLSHR